MSGSNAILLQLILIHIVIWDFATADNVLQRALPPKVYNASLSKEMADFINNEANTTWTAGRVGRFRTLEEAEQLLTPPPVTGSIQRSHVLLKKRIDQSIDRQKLPDQFDSRQKWPKCDSIGRIRDQSACASGWALAAVGAMTDRICIHSDASSKVELSALDMMSCCQDRGGGCNGGFSEPAWLCWEKQGIVTGGSNQSASGCKPYPFAPCSHHAFRLQQASYPPCPERRYETPECSRRCVEGSRLDYEEDKHFAKSVYFIEDKNEEAIKLELMTNGPVEAPFEVYGDFLTYRGGIYQHVTGEFKGLHAVKLIGWGETTGVPYWLVANSWNEEWGEKGFFRVLRGTNECGIEERVIAGMPKLYGRAEQP